LATVALDVRGSKKKSTFLENAHDSSWAFLFFELIFMNVYFYEIVYSLDN